MIFQNMILSLSLSLLETGQRNSRFLFLLSKLEKGIQVSLSPLETGQENSRFLFLLSRRGKGIRISLSPLKCGEIVLISLFFSMTAEPETPRSHCQLLLDGFYNHWYWYLDGLLTNANKCLLGFSLRNFRFSSPTPWTLCFRLPSGVLV